jgi:hypothetical protein
MDQIYNRVQPRAELFGAKARVDQVAPLVKVGKCPRFLLAGCNERLGRRARSSSG